VITGRRRFPGRLACLPRPAWCRQGGGALVFQDLDLGEALSAEAQLGRPREGGKDLSLRRAQTGPPEAKSLGDRA